MTDRHLRADQHAHARRATGQPEPALREQIAEAVRDNLKRRTVPPVELFPGGVIQAQGGMGLTEYDIADVTLGVVQPQLDAKQAEADKLRGFIERGFDTHMQFGVIEPDGTTTMLPCADWCHACKLEKAEAERDALRDSLRTAAGLLRDTAERAEQQRTVNAGALRAAATALDEIAGNQP